MLVAATAAAAAGIAAGLATARRRRYLAGPLPAPGPALAPPDADDDDPGSLNPLAAPDGRQNEPPGPSPEPTPEQLAALTALFRGESRQNQEAAAPAPAVPTAPPARLAPLPPLVRRRPAAGAPAATAPPPAQPPPAAGPRRSRRVQVAGVVAVVAVVGGGVAAYAASRGGDHAGDRSAVAGQPTGHGAAAAAPTTTALPVPTDPAPDPSTAFAQAGGRLLAEGSFRYTGTVSADDVSLAHPSRWLAVDIDVDGQVSVAAGRLHEVATDRGGRATETVAAGPQVWGRRADTQAGLAAAAWALLPDLSGGDPPARGTALLAGWLAGAVNPTAAGTDDLGRHRYQATIPAAVLGRVVRDRPAVPATVVLTLDGTGAPVHVEIATPDDGPRLRLALDLVDLGVPVTITPP